jgi:hypothetical protein
VELAATSSSIGSSTADAGSLSFNDDKLENDSLGVGSEHMENGGGHLEAGSSRLDLDNNQIEELDFLGMLGLTKVGGGDSISGQTKKWRLWQPEVSFNANVLLTFCVIVPVPVFCRRRNYGGIGI